MTILLSLIAAIVLISFGWLLGYGSGYTLGLAHGRETAEASPITVHTQTSLNAAEVYQLVLREMDRTRPSPGWS